MRTPAPREHVAVLPHEAHTFGVLRVACDRIEALLGTRFRHFLFPAASRVVLTQNPGTDPKLSYDSCSSAEGPKKLSRNSPRPEIESPLPGFCFAVASARLTSPLSGTFRTGRKFLWALYRWIKRGLQGALPLAAWGCGLLERGPVLGPASFRAPKLRRQSLRPRRARAPTRGRRVGRGGRHGRAAAAPGGDGRGAAHQASRAGLT